MDLLMFQCPKQHIQRFVDGKIIQNQYQLAFPSRYNLIQKNEEMGTGASIGTAGERASGAWFKSPKGPHFSSASIIGFHLGTGFPPTGSGIGFDGGGSHLIHPNDVGLSRWTLIQAHNRPLFSAN